MDEMSRLPRHSQLLSVRVKSIQTKQIRSSQVQCNAVSHSIAYRGGQVEGNVGPSEGGAGLRHGLGQHPPSASEQVPCHVILK